MLATNWTPLLQTDHPSDRLSPVKQLACSPRPAVWTGGVQAHNQAPSARGRAETS